jgi:hypothetical protein
VLLAAGAPGKRRALPNSRIMIHQPLAGMEGTAEEIMIHAKEFRYIKQRLNMILQKHTGQPLDEIEKHTDRDNFMAAEKAREYGLIDEVIDRIGETYADVPEGEKTAIFNSAGYLEIAINKGNAAGLFGLKGYVENSQQSQLAYQTVRIVFG